MSEQAISFHSNEMAWMEVTMNQTLYCYGKFDSPNNPDPKSWALQLIQMDNLPRQFSILGSHSEFVDSGCIHQPLS